MKNFITLSLYVDEKRAFGFSRGMNGLCPLTRSNILDDVVAIIQKEM
jgi:hypothetical protein